MRFPLWVVAVATVSLSACGGGGADEPPAKARPKPRHRPPAYAGKFDQKQVIADFEAMALSDEAAEEVYVCLERKDDLNRIRRCDGPVINGRAYKVGTGVGEIEVKKPIDNDFAVSTRSSTGAVFTTVGAVPGAVADHECRARGQEGGCRKGFWFRPHLKLARGDHRGQDAQVQRFISALTFRLNVCRGVERSYTRCTSPKKLATYADTTVIQPPLPIGRGRGQVELRNIRRETFQVIGHSQSGNEFVLAGRLRGSWEHRCRAIVADGWCRGGRW